MRFLMRHLHTRINKKGKCHVPRKEEIGPWHRSIKHRNAQH